jgi:hypothetical protein
VLLVDASARRLDLGRRGLPFDIRPNHREGLRPSLPKSPVKGAQGVRIMSALFLRYPGIFGLKPRFLQKERHIKSNECVR